MFNGYFSTCSCISLDSPAQLLLALSSDDLKNVEYIIATSNPDLDVTQAVIHQIESKMETCPLILIDNLTMALQSSLVPPLIAAGLEYIVDYDDLEPYKGLILPDLPIVIDYCQVDNISYLTPTERLKIYKKISSDVDMANFINIYAHSNDIPDAYKFDQRQDGMKILSQPESQNCKVVDTNSFYMVKTAREAMYERFIQRRFYRDDQNNPIRNYAFFIGTDGSGNPGSQYIDEETSLYDDFVIADFADTYNQLPLKTKSMYEFAVNCSDDIEMFFFHDSDAIAHPEIEKLLNKNITEENSLEIFREQLRRPFEQDEFIGMWHEAFQTEEPELVCLRRTGINRTAMIWVGLSLLNSFNLKL